MRTPAKPDSSYASNRLTRSGYKGTSLLSTFRGKKSEEESNPCKQEPELEDINAPPISSEDEDEDEDIKQEQSEDSEDEKKIRTPGKTLEEKLAEEDTNVRRSKRGSQSAKVKKEDPEEQKPYSQKAARTRTASQMDDEEDIAFSSFRSSQSSSKRNRKSYGAQKASRKSYDSKIPPSSSSESLSNKAKSENTEDQSPKAKEEFKVPDDASSPVKPEFKEPPPLSADLLPSSSFPHSSIRDQIDDSDDESSLTSISSVPSAFGIDIDLSQAEAKLKEEGDSKLPLCPICKEAVDPGLLMLFQAQPNQRIRDQERFCKSHKASSAEKEWQEKGYPKIDWDHFDERIEGHFAGLEEILVSDKPSYYRGILDNAMKSGKAKNFRLTLFGDGLETISCGYYGTRGASKMLQAVTTHFSKQLRRLATSDQIVKTAGIAGYAQSVLVPELASRLVKEDMGVDDESARKIMRDSIEIGEKLNFALNDVVPVPERTERVLND